MGVLSGLMPPIAVLERHLEKRRRTGIAGDERQASQGSAPLGEWTGRPGIEGSAPPGE